MIWEFLLFILLFIFFGVESQMMILIWCDPKKFFKKFIQLRAYLTTLIRVTTARDMWRLHDMIKSVHNKIHI